MENDKLTTLLLVTIWCTCQFRPSIGLLEKKMHLIDNGSTKQFLVFLLSHSNVGLICLEAA